LVVATNRDEISLRDLVHLLGRSKWVIIPMVLVCGIIVAVIAWLRPNQYEAIVLLSPVSSTSGVGSKLSGSASQIGGLASLIGINIGGDSSKAESIAYLQSEVLTERFIQDNQLLPVLYPERWSAADKKWIVSDPAKVPTLWKANRKFLEIRNVTEDKKSGLVKMSITWTDPVMAANWANGIVRMANDNLRAKAIKEAEQHIAYLNEEASHTDLAPIRTAIYAVLESEIKNAMLAKGPGDYALKVIDPAVAPELKSGPLRSLWVLGGCMAGFSLALLALFLRSAWRAGSPS
jgi:uncharacterized protein involved in exopolysaccharide biosynthesis